MKYNYKIFWKLGELRSIRRTTFETTWPYIFLSILQVQSNWFSNSRMPFVPKNIYRTGQRNIVGTPWMEAQNWAKISRRQPVNGPASVALRNFRPSPSMYTNETATESDKSREDKSVEFLVGRTCTWQTFKPDYLTDETSKPTFSGWITLLIRDHVANFHRRFLVAASISNILGSVVR